MATAAAPPPPSATQQRFRPSQPSKPASAKTSPPVAKSSSVPQAPLRDVVDVDESWIVEIQAAKEEEFQLRAKSLYDELLKTLADAGPFIDHAEASALQDNYQRELEKIRQAQKEEVENLIQFERQSRLWSLGAEDPEWEGWQDFREEQLCILNNIQKEAGLEPDISAGQNEDNEFDEVGKQVKETAEELERTTRQFKEWERTEELRMRDRAQWREAWKGPSANIQDRRQRDYAESEARSKAQQDQYDRTEQLAAEARLGSATARNNPSLTTLFANGETYATWRPSASAASDTPSRVSYAESYSWSSDTSFTTFDTTPASSVYINPLESPPPRPTNTRPIPVQPVEERSRSSSGAGYFGVGSEERQRTPYRPSSSSSSSRIHGPGHTPSPTPTSHAPSSNPLSSSSTQPTTGTTALPERWIPPELAQHPPQKKSSMHFDNRSSREAGPARMKSALFGESPAPPHPPIPEETSKSTSEASHRPQSQPPVDTHIPIHSSNAIPGTASTADHHIPTAGSRSASHSYPFSGSTATSAGVATSGTSASTSAPSTSGSTSATANRVPSSTYEAPPAPGLRSKPLPKQPPAEPVTTTTTASASTPASSSSSSTTKPSYPSTHTHIPTQRQFTFPSQPSPTEPKIFHPQATRSVSTSSGPPFSASVPSYSARTSFSSATTAVPPMATSPVEESNANRPFSTGAPTSSFASQAANPNKNNPTFSAHSTAHATQTPLGKASSQTQSQLPTYTHPPQAQTPAPTGPYSSSDDHRTRLRQQYVADEERRAEEERRRREDEERRKREQEEEEKRRKEQEANERRAEEAKRRGEERRREEERRHQEEMARDAERREQERKARKAAAAAAGMSGSYPGPGMSGSYPGSGFGGIPNVGGAYGSMPGASSTYGSSANHNSSSSGSYSSASASVTSPPTPPPSSSASVPELWDAYEKQWAAMAKAPHLRFRSMPWPVLIPVSSPEQLLPIRIAQFIFHAQHSQGKSKEKRLREALLKWHPDRFNSKWLPKVVSEDREKVEDGAGRVVRALNELLNSVNNNGFGE